MEKNNDPSYEGDNDLWRYFEEENLKRKEETKKEILRQLSYDFMDDVIIKFLLTSESQPTKLLTTRELSILTGNSIYSLNNTILPKLLSIQVIKQVNEGTAYGYYLNTEEQKWWDEAKEIIRKNQTRKQRETTE